MGFSQTRQPGARALTGHVGCSAKPRILDLGPRESNEQSLERQ